MRHAIYLAPFGELSEPAAVVDLAVAAEERGWDGVFLWDHIWRSEARNARVADPWIVLAAVAARTSRIRLGPMVVPLARRRPQKVARETVSLDRLSAGRLILGVGLGVDTGGELARFGELVDPVERGTALDEALVVLRSLWSGREVHHRGDRYLVDRVAFQPAPSNPDGIPVWGAARGGCPPRPLRRSAALQGLFPVGASIPQLEAMLDTVSAYRGGLADFDVAYIAAPEADADRLAAVGVTWMLAAVADGAPLADAQAFVDAGPPS
jgi:alkanesulfonate monooxygenase SsuD/methylene tetrahydromethanopterin reductase-like flavin-dependent oxidoreductase (luciferase family)